MRTRDAPFVDLDRIDVFLADVENDAEMRQLDVRPRSGPRLRFIYPYDVGVLMYSRDGPVVPIFKQSDGRAALS